MATLVTRDDTYVLNYSTKYLARDNSDARHNYGQYASGDPRARIAEAWRFPIVDSYYDGRDYVASLRLQLRDVHLRRRQPVDHGRRRHRHVRRSPHADSAAARRRHQVLDRQRRGAERRGAPLQVPAWGAGRPRSDQPAARDHAGRRRVVAVFHGALHQPDLVRGLGGSAAAAAHRSHPAVPDHRGAALPRLLLRPTSIGRRRTRSTPAPTVSISRSAP